MSEICLTTRLMDWISLVSQGKWMPTVVLWLVCFGNALAYICSLAEQWMPCWPCFWKSQWAWSKVGHIYIYILCGESLHGRVSSGAPGPCNFI